MAMVGTRPRAGRAAADRYRQGRRAWRRSDGIKRVRLLAWPLVAVAVTGPALPKPWSWLAALVGGAFGMLWLCLRERPPDYVDQWRRGAEGEEKTERALTRLGPAWSVHHDLQAGYGNWDHVVVGPHAVFLLDSKNLGGTVSIRGRKVFVERALLPDDGYAQDLGRSAKWQAAQVNDEIVRATGLARWVQPVVVFWGEFPQQVVEMDRVAYVHGDRLTAWLRGQPPRMPSEGRDAVCAALDAMPRAHGNEPAATS
jgi:nuclease-like protein